MLVLCTHQQSEVVSCVNYIYITIFTADDDTETTVHTKKKSIMVEIELE